MTPQVFSVTVQKIPPVAERGRHVLILLKDGNNQYLLSSKTMYPKGMYRMVGGGVEKKETPLTAAQRELHEELKLDVPQSELHELATIKTQIHDAENRVVNFTTTIYFLDVGERGVIPGDDINTIIRVTPSAFTTLIQRFFTLPSKVDPLVKFSWHDYGKIYGPIHQIAFEAAQKLTP